MRIHTASGSTYTLVNGRLTRKASPYTPPDYFTEVIDGEPVEIITPARRGESFRFRILGTRGVVSTSIVTSIS